MMKIVKTTTCLVKRWSLKLLDMVDFHSSVGSWPGNYIGDEHPKVAEGWVRS